MEKMEASKLLMRMQMGAFTMEETVEEFLTGLL